MAPGLAMTVAAGWSARPTLSSLQAAYRQWLQLWGENRASPCAPILSSAVKEVQKGDLGVKQQNVPVGLHTALCLQPGEDQCCPCQPGVLFVLAWGEGSFAC